MTLIRLDAKRYASFALMMLVAVLLALASAKPAQSALLDSAGTGNGVSGAFDPSTSGYINEVAPVTTATAGSSSITIGTRIATGYATNGASGGQTTANAVNFGSSRLIMIIQSKGYGGTANSGDQTPIDLSSNQTGRWEIARISGAVSGSTVNLTAPLAYTYTTGAQIVSIPEFTTMNIVASRVISARPWNGSTGGVIAFLVQGAIATANSTSSINANAAGLRGGLKAGNATGTNCIEYDSNTRDGTKGEGIVSNYYDDVLPADLANSRGMGNRANAAGGGNCENAGGGGGGNGGMGGQGGLSFDAGSEQWPVGGLGGQNLVYSPLDHAVFGGGGGSGDANNAQNGVGGIGGGLVFVRAGSMSGGGTIAANGAAGGNSGAVGPSDGAGGGGAGGVVYARFVNAAACVVSANGGSGGLDASTGGVHGPGGGGGGGRVYLQKASGTCNTSILAGAPGYTINGTAGSQRGSGPSGTSDPSSVGLAETNPQGFAAPTAVLNVPAASQTVGITSTLSGTATALSTVRVYIDGTYRGSTIATGGNWTFTSPALAGGAHTAYVIPVNLGVAGAQAPSPDRSFTVDATAPAAPVITNPGGSLITNNATPTISGTAEANSTVTFRDGGTDLAGSALTNGSGNWSFTLPTLTYGTHSITAKATDPYNNVGAYSTARSIDYDNIPAVVTITSPAEGAYLNTPTPTVIGTADKPGVVTCQVDAGTPVTCTSGWTVPSGEITTQGAHSITIRYTDLAGNITTVVRSFTVDTIQPTMGIYSPALDGALVKSSRPQIGFDVTDTNLSPHSECRIDSQDWGECDSPFTAPTVLDGAHTAWVRHTDRAGNLQTVSRNIVVDTTLPVATIQQPANASFQGPSPAVSFTITDVNPGTTYCQIDGGAENPCTSPTTIGPLAAGSHTLAIRHEDAAGNAGSSTSVSFIVDTTPPVVVVDWPPEDQIVNTKSPQILFTVTEANPSATSSCQIDGGAPTSCTSPYVATNLAEGHHTLLVSHTDKAGNSATSLPREFDVDSIAPIAPTINSNRGSLTKLTDVSFTFAAPEPGIGHLECQLDNNGWNTSCTSPQAFAGLALGEHSFFVRQIDNAGNVGQIGTHTWTIDQTPPPAPIVSGPSGISGAPVETFSYFDAEQGVTFSCSFDSGTAFACNSLSYSTPTLTNGSHSFSVIATDAAGNDSAATELNWQTNLSNFNIAITGAPNALSTSPDATFLFSATENPDNYYCKLDSDAEQTCASPKSYLGLSNGSHTFSVYAKIGTESTPIASRTWTVDATPPTLDVTVPLQSGTTGGTVNVQFTASDANGVTTTCKLDIADPVPCSSGYVLNNLSAGAHTLVVTAKDPAGNETPVTRDWTVDATPPVTTFNSTPAVATNLPAASFSFTSNKVGSTFECSLDGAPWTTCTSPQNLTVAEGTHTLQVRATAMGNTETAPATYTWAYDATPPAPPVVISGSPIYSGPTVTFRGTADPGNDVQLYVSGQPVGGATATTEPNGNWEIVRSSTPDGTYSVCFTQTDAAGNTSDCSSPAITLVVDTAPPTVAISSPSSGAITSSNVIAFDGSDSSASAVTYECQADDLTPGAPDPAYEVCSPPNFAPELISGHQYTVTVRATDALENHASAAVTFTHDNTPPSPPTITTPAQNGATNSAPISIGGAAESGAVVRVYVDGVLRPATTTAAADAWSYTFSPDLTERATPYDITVTATDAAGNVSQTSAVRKITVDRTSPVKPAITAPTNGSGTNNPTLTITGDAEADSTLELMIDGSPVNIAVSSGGSWNYVPETPLSNGSHTLSAKAIDAAGNQSPVSNSVTFTVDNSPPSVAISSPLGGAHVNSTTVPVDFTATDNGSFNLVCRLNGNVVTPCAAPSKTLSGLGQGSQTFTIEATDVGGNVATAAVTFTVDTVAPSAPSILTPTAGAHSTGNQILVSGTAEVGVTINLELSGGATASVETDGSGNWGHTFTALSDGDYTVNAIAVDAAQNSSGQSSIGFSIDNDPPDAPAIVSPAAGAEVQSIATITGTGGEPGATVTVTVAGNPTQAVNNGLAGWSLTLASPITAEGSYSISVRQRDAAGNLGNSSAITVTVDSTAPALTISSPTSGAALANPRPPINFIASDGNTLASVQCKVGAAAPVNCTDGWQPPTDLPDGSHSVQVQATDAAGNATTESVTFTVDTNAPDTNWTGSLPGDTNGLIDKNVAPTFTFSSEPGATFRCKLDSNPWVTCTSPRALSALTDISHTFYVKAVDAAGNEDQTPVWWTWTVDSTAPPKPVVTEPSLPTIGFNQPLIQGTAEPGSTVTVRINGVAFGTTSTNVTGEWSFTPPAPLADGSVSITASARDVAGNISPLSDPKLVTIDAVMPTVSITGGPNGLTNNTDPTFEFTANETATFECNLDNAGWIECANDGPPSTVATQDYSVTDQGSHTLKVRAFDLGDNQSNEATRTWTLDSVAPEKPIVTTPATNNPTTVLADSTPTISGTAEPGSSVEIFRGATSIGTVNADGLTGTWSITSGVLADGSYTVSARATDAAANTSPASDDVTFEVDTTPPGSRQLSQQAGSGLSGAKPVFLISSTDPQATYTCAIDGGAAGACTSPYTPAQTLSAGGHSLVVTYTDPVGNAAQETLGFTQTSAPTPPPAPPTIDPGECIPKGLAIIDLAAKGKKVSLTGFARRAYIGQKVEVFYKAKSKKAVAKAVVGADGTFKVSFKAPKKSLWKSKKTAYSLKIGSVKTAWSQLVRRMATTSATYAGGKLTVKGAVTKPLFPKGKATVTVRSDCNGPFNTLGSVTIGKSGKFSASLPLAPASNVVFVRVSAIVGTTPKRPKKSKTWSFTIPVRTQ
jgi:hypothetical protein